MTPLRPSSTQFVILSVALISKLFNRHGYAVDSRYGLCGSVPLTGAVDGGGTIDAAEISRKT